MSVPQFRSPDESIADVSTVGEFWRWAMSDLLNNRNRGILAEFMVAKALLGTLDCPRIEWDCGDLVYRGYNIEVKSSAYVQSWHGEGAKPSVLRFGINAHECWDARTNLTNPERKRHAELYVFSVFPADPHDPTRDVLDAGKWCFYVTTTKHLETLVSLAKPSVTLSEVESICGEGTAYTNLKQRVDILLDDLTGE